VEDCSDFSLKLLINDIPQMCVGDEKDEYAEKYQSERILDGKQDDAL
jgi:hypothetical protein